MDFRFVSKDSLHRHYLSSLLFFCIIQSQLEVYTALLLNW
uniref:Uncharacterized protein n=1 Tax=Setaria viridis TaxID=4556 RepID=A0A4U6VAF7_SETVI|nr:hypothetical protein SEVIR_3G025033v2 [Setaria viridis]